MNSIVLRRTESRDVRELYILTLKANHFLSNLAGAVGRLATIRNYEDEDCAAHRTAQRQRPALFSI